MNDIRYLSENCKIGAENMKLNSFTRENRLNQIDTEMFSEKKKLFFFWIFVKQASVTQNNDI